MSRLLCTDTPIEGLKVLTPHVFGDERGSFCETWNARDLEACGIDAVFVQDNESRSVQGILRGMHFQLKHPQAKLVRVTSGAVYDAVVDLRPGSASWGKAFGLILSEENHRQLFIPRGFAHGYLVLSERATFCYKTDDYYAPGDEGGLLWSDPALGIAWPGLPDGMMPVLNDRDRSWPCLQDLHNPD